MSLNDKKEGVAIVFEGEKILEKEVTELFALFRWLETRRGDGFRKYLASPFFIDKADIDVLPPLFTKLYQNFNNEKSSRINGSSLIKGMGLKGRPPGEKRNFLKAKIRQLQRHLCDFFAQKQLESAPHFRHFLLADFFQYRKEPEWSHRSFMNWQESVDALPLSFEKVQANWQLLQKCYFALATDKGPDAGRLLKALRRRFELFTAIFALLYENESDNRRKLFQPLAPEAEPRQEILRKEAERCRGLEVLESLLVQLLEMQRAESFQPSRYKAFKSFFLAHFESFDRYMQLMVVHFLKNYLYRNARRGYAETAEENFFWAKFQAEQGLLLLNNEFTEATFLNIASIAASNGEFEFLAQFRNEYLRYLPKEHRKKTDKLVKVMGFFYSESHRSVIDFIQLHFSQKQPKDYHFHLRIKSYRLRSALVLYVRGDPGFSDEFEKAYSDMEKFLERHRNRLSGAAIASFQNCKNLAQQIARAHFHFRLAEEQEKLISRAEKYKELQGKIWFLKQLQKGFG